MRKLTKWYGKIFKLRFLFLLLALSGSGVSYSCDFDGVANGSYLDYYGKVSFVVTNWTSYNLNFGVGPSSSAAVSSASTVLAPSSSIAVNGPTHMVRGCSTVGSSDTGTDAMYVPTVMFIQDTSVSTDQYFWAAANFTQGIQADGYSGYVENITSSGWAPLSALDCSTTANMNCSSSTTSFSSTFYKGVSFQASGQIPGPSPAWSFFVNNYSIPGVDNDSDSSTFVANWDLLFMWPQEALTQYASYGQDFYIELVPSVSIVNFQSAQEYATATMEFYINVVFGNITTNNHCPWIGSASLAAAS